MAESKSENFQPNTMIYDILKAGHFFSEEQAFLINVRFFFIIKCINYKRGKICCINDHAREIVSSTSIHKSIYFTKLTKF